MAMRWSGCVGTSAGYGLGGIVSVRVPREGSGTVDSRPGGYSDRARVCKGTGCVLSMSMRACSFAARFVDIEVSTLRRAASLSGSTGLKRGSNCAGRLPI